MTRVRVGNINRLKNIEIVCVVEFKSGYHSIMGSLLIKLGILCMNIVSTYLVKISVGEIFCERKKLSRKFLSGNER